MSRLYSDRPRSCVLRLHRSPPTGLSSRLSRFKSFRRARAELKGTGSGGRAGPGERGRQLEYLFSGLPAWVEVVAERFER